MSSDPRLVRALAVATLLTTAPAVTAQHPAAAPHDPHASYATEGESDGSPAVRDLTNNDWWPNRLDLSILHLRQAPYPSYGCFQQDEETGETLVTLTVQPPTNKPDPDDAIEIVLWRQENASAPTDPIPYSVRRHPLTAWPEEVMITEPPAGLAFNTGRACLRQSQVPVTLTRMTCSKSASEKSSTDAVGPVMPALASRISRPPRFSVA